MKETQGNVSLAVTATLCTVLLAGHPLSPTAAFTMTPRHAFSFSDTHARLYSSQPQRHQLSSTSLSMSLKPDKKSNNFTSSGPLHQSARSVDCDEVEVPATFLPDGIIDEQHQAIMTTLAPETKLSNMKVVLNGALLTFSFGLALYTIFQVDAGMTRGWTQQEIMMRIPVDTWRSYEFSLNESPMETKTAINVIIYLLGDWLSQTVFQKKNILDFDAARTLKNGSIGLCFGPLVHQYYAFSDQILPIGVDDSMMNRVYKILMDQTLYLSVKCSIYIMAVGVLNGSSFEEAADNVKNRIKDVMVTAVSGLHKCTHPHVCSPFDLMLLLLFIVTSGNFGLLFIALRTPLYQHNTECCGSTV
jgi:protein Mpv17